MKIEENKCINDLDRIMNDLGNKKSFRDVDDKFNGQDQSKTYNSVSASKADGPKTAYEN